MKWVLFCMLALFFATLAQVNALPPTRLNAVFLLAD